jgi:hypothetical protein
MPDEHGNETREEALERIAEVRRTQIFGDTPTDPTIGDVTVPAHDEESANLAAAEVAAQAEDGDGDAEDLSQEEAKRQLEATPSEEDFEAAEEANETGEEPVDTEAASDDSSDATDLTAEEKVKRIEAAGSPEEVDALAEGDERKTVQRAAEKKRSSWG